MLLSVDVSIEGKSEDVWNVISDIENATDRISGIEKVEILEPTEGDLIGLKWRETRTLFGKTATEVMWVTDAVKNQYYTTQAESHGSVYQTKLSIQPQNGSVKLMMEFSAEAQSFGAKFMYFVMGPMFKNATKKALQQDLDDIKLAVESQTNQ